MILWIIFRRKKIFGKEIGNDFSEGKMTLPLILLYKRSSNKEKLFLEYLINKDKLSKKDFLSVVKKDE